MVGVNIIHFKGVQTSTYEMGKIPTCPRYSPSYQLLSTCRVMYTVSPFINVSSLDEKANWPYYILWKHEITQYEKYNKIFPKLFILGCLCFEVICCSCWQFLLGKQDREIKLISSQHVIKLIY